MLKAARVFVTGLGVVSPIGLTVADFWLNLLAGRSGIGRVEAFDTARFRAKCGGEIRGFDAGAVIRRQDASTLPRTTQFAVAVARQAIEQAALEPSPGLRVGVCFGTTMGNQSVVEAANDAFQGGLEPSLSASTYPAAQIPAVVARELGVSGPGLMAPTACAAGNYAIGLGFDLLRSGRADAVICGGSDALARGCYAVFERLGAITPDVCRPFDAGRRGMMVSEGAGAVLLESEASVARRGATPLAEMLGYGLACDGYNSTAPHPGGRGAARAMRRALAVAGLGPEAVSYISAHGTGTRANDASEAAAVREVFGEHAGVPTSSIKSMLGHTMGAASAIEAVATALAIRDGVMPPTMNFCDPDPDCLSDVVANVARRGRVETALSNAFAFGGNIATIIFAQPSGVST
jgi:3-oxoacyl-[acyl-carrier-protein] synthase II